MVTVLDSAPGPVDLAIGPGGDIFFTDVAGGKIHRIVSNFTPPPPTPVDPVNVAPFKPVQQSSNWDNLGPERAVDGLLNGTEQEVSHTEKDFQSWWQIDLTESVMNAPEVWTVIRRPWGVRRRSLSGRRTPVRLRRACREALMRCAGMRLSRRRLMVRSADKSAKPMRPRDSNSPSRSQESRLRS